MAGEKGTKAVFYFITNDFDISLEELSNRVTDLHNAFVRVFGLRLSVVLENAIAKDFCDRLSQKYNRGLTLSETVEKAHKELANKSRKARARS